MSLEKTLSTDIVTAMKAKDQTKLTALRMLKTALTNKNIEKGRDLDTAEELAVLSMLVKQRRDSIDQYTKGGRKDLADKEQAEILILETYQPASASMRRSRQRSRPRWTTPALPVPRTWEGDEGRDGGLAGKTVDGKKSARREGEAGG